MMLINAVSKDGNCKLSLEIPEDTYSDELQDILEGLMGMLASYLAATKVEWNSKGSVVLLGDLVSRLDALPELPEVLKSA